jgi:cation diffusion facilitator CzcD-associated flavoprotein CzcO
MLQRSPTYVVSRPAEDALANRLRKWLPAKLAYGLIRWKNVLFGMYFFNLARKKPQQVKAYILNMVSEQLGKDLVEKHFTPRYNPWDQRLCLVPNGDLFEAIKSDRADVVTDHIDTFTETGIRLKSGTELEADLVVTATGLKLEVLAGIDISVDGKPVDLSKTFNYKGMMYSDVPNLASSFGYTNASWTLKCDLTCGYVCRLLNHMDATGNRQCTPRLTDSTVEPEPWLDFSSGYVQRAVDLFPKQGSKAPWKLHQNYAKDLVALKFGKIEDGAMEFSNKASPKHTQKAA